MPEKFKFSPYSHISRLREMWSELRENPKKVQEVVPTPLRRVLDDNELFISFLSQGPVRMGGHALNFGVYPYAVINGDLPWWTAAGAGFVTNSIGLMMTYGTILYYGSNKESVLRQVINHVGNQALLSFDYLGDSYIALENSVIAALRRTADTTKT